MLWHCARFKRCHSLHKAADAAQCGPPMIISQDMPWPTNFMEPLNRPTLNAPSNTVAVLSVQGKGTGLV